MQDEARMNGAAEETAQAVSATECTGLVPALPQTEAEEAHRRALCAVHRAKKPGRMYRTR